MPHRPAAQGRQLPAARGAGPRALARARRLQRVAAPPRGRAAVRLLRGPADGQRPPRLPPRAGARLQGRLPALQDDAGLLLRPQGRLGLPRPAGRDRRPEPARDREQAADRGLRDRGVQREVPRVGLRVPRGLDEADRADRLLGRPRRALPHARHRLHRVGLVGAEAAVGQGPALRGLQGRPVLPEGRHVAVQPRGLAGLQGRRGPERLRPLPGHEAGGRAARGRRRCSCGRRRPGRWSPTPRSPSIPSSPTCARARATCWPRRSSPACSARTRRSRTASRAPTWSARPTSRRSRSSRPPSTARRATPCCPADFVSAEDGTGIVHTAIAFGEDDFRLGAEHGPQRHQPGPRRRHLRRAHRPVRGRLRQGRRRRPDRGPRGARADVPLRAPAAQLPALLALRHAAALLRQADLVHPHLGGQGPAAGGQRDASTGTRAHQARPLRAAGWRTTSTGRSGASATGARRCRSGATRRARRCAVGSFEELQRALAA